MRDVDHTLVCHAIQWSNQSHSWLASIVCNIVKFGGGLQLNKYKIFTRGFHGCNQGGSLWHYVAEWHTRLELSHHFLNLRFFDPPDYWKRFFCCLGEKKEKFALGSSNRPIIRLAFFGFVKERFHKAVEIDILGIFEGYSSLQIWPPQKIFQGRNYSGRMT